MTEGDSIWNMANKAYGDPGMWRVIADANDIDDPAKIEMGKDLIIPVLTG
jgi:nucleoid-associated protein YgaU